MKNISKTLNIVSVLVFIIAFITKGYSINRLTLILLGVIISTIAFINSSKRKILMIVLYVFTWLLGLYFIDVGSVYFFNMKPIFAIERKSSDNFISYDSILYRQFECNNKEYLDIFYKKSDYCSSDLLEEKDINALSSDIINNFNEYKNKFYIIDAKVSYKEGNNKIDLKSYNNEEDSINGNVAFNDNIIYKCNFINKNNIDNIKLYDNIKLVGRIANLKKENDVYIITIKDAYLLDNYNYSDFEVNVVENKSCDKDKTEYVNTSNFDYYTSCLSKIYAVYEDDVYELSYVLKDERISLDDLLKDYIDVESKKIDDKEYNLYKFDDYNILVCNDKNVIIGNSKLSLDDNYCEISDASNDDL